MAGPGASWAGQWEAPPFTLSPSKPVRPVLGRFPLYLWGGAPPPFRPIPSRPPETLGWERGLVWWQGQAPWGEGVALGLPGALACVSLSGLFPVQLPRRQRAGRLAPTPSVTVRGTASVPALTLSLPSHPRTQVRRSSEGGGLRTRPRPVPTLLSPAVASTCIPRGPSVRPWGRGWGHPRQQPAPPNAQGREAAAGLL